jgi:integrase
MAPVAPAPSVPTALPYAKHTQQRVAAPLSKRAGDLWSRSSAARSRSRGSFATFWARLLQDRRPYLTGGSFIDFETHGRKRLLPAFGDVPLGRMDEDLVRSWLAAMARRVEADEISAKTVNNARTCLSVALNEACRRGLIARNPCAAVPALPVDRQELDYLRLDEIEPYLDACMSHYRALAHFLIGTGARISEALAVEFQHLAPEQGVVRIYRQRGRDGADSRPTKGKRFRSVQVGPALVATPAELERRRRPAPHDWVFLCPTPRRGRHATRSTVGPPNRRTVHDWHEAALIDAGLRDMPLHALRHTAREESAWSRLPQTARRVAQPQLK